MNRKSQIAVISLNRTHSLVYVLCDLLPGIQSLRLRRYGGFHPDADSFSGSLHPKINLIDQSDDGRVVSAIRPTNRKTKVSLVTLDRAHAHSEISCDFFPCAEDSARLLDQDDAHVLTLCLLLCNVARSECEILVMEDVRYGPDKSKSQLITAAFAAWEAVAANKNCLMCLAMPAVMNDLVNTSLWHARSGRIFDRGIG